VRCASSNLGRLTVGVDLGDKWSSYCILGLDGEVLAEGQLRTTQQDVEEFFQALTTARVVMEVGTHSAWTREVVAGCGHEVRVANPRQMEGPKQRKRKNDRVDAHRLARMGRVDPQSLFPIEHRSAEVRQDLVMLRARDALVAASYCSVYHHGDTTWQRLPKHMSRITVQRDWHR
jgi:transposase